MSRMYTFTFSGCVKKALKRGADIGAHIGSRAQLPLTGQESEIYICFHFYGVGRKDISNSVECL